MAGIFFERIDYQIIDELITISQSDRIIKYV